MGSTFDTESGPISLGAEIARGGEGVVYEIPSDPSIVAKIYSKPPDRNKWQKLSAMVQAATPDVLKVAAWPTCILRRHGNLTGLVMRRIPATNHPVHELYTPKTRFRQFPGANWQFLINVASNVTRGFAVMHRAGIIIGDVNHGNILVAQNGITSFIDCDSFQIRSNGQVFLCEVGVSTYTPPELQNKNFNHVIRTQNHDCFGLAVLLFHLLFMGRHPFAGRYSGTGYMPIERAIGECRFAFGRLAKQVLMSPPPNSLLLSQVSPAMAEAFERAFGAEALRGVNRPTSLEWLSILEQFQKEQTRCTSKHEHLYYHKLPSCPWCQIESQGIVLFVEIGVAVTPGLNIDVLWKRLSSLPALGPLPPIEMLANLAKSISATPEALSVGRQRKLRIGVGIVAVILTVCLVLGHNLDGSSSLVLIAFSIGFGLWFPRDQHIKRTAARKTVKELGKGCQDLQARYASECSESIFQTKVKELDALRAQYNQIPLMRQRKLQELERNKHQLQLHDFLDRFDLSDAKIPSIGPGRKAMLASYGIDTAADISYGAITQVPGIGPTYATKLLAWRQSVESRFRFDPQKAVARAEVDKVDREIRDIRLKCEGVLTRGVQDAAALHANLVALRQSYGTQLQSATRALAQAQVNFKAM